MRRRSVLSSRGKFEQQDLHQRRSPRTSCSGQQCDVGEQRQHPGAWCAVLAGEARYHLRHKSGPVAQQWAASSRTALLLRMADAQWGDNGASWVHACIPLAGPPALTTDAERADTAGMQLPASAHRVASQWPPYIRGKGQYRWALSLTDRDDGVARLGANHRLRAAVSKMLSGEWRWATRAPASAPNALALQKTQPP